MEFTDKQIEKYSRQIILPEIGVEGQEKICEAKVLIIGAGGLGSPVALYLAAAGIGTLGLIDFDIVDLSNLQRQILHFEKDVGLPKIQSAKEKLKALNPDIVLNTYPEALTHQNAEKLFAEYDFIVEGSDNFGTKYLTNDASVLTNKPFSIAGLLRYEGQLTTVVPGHSPCYRCLFPTPPPADAVPTCASAGVLGSLAGVVGSLQATEALKYITGIGDLLTGSFLTLNILNMDFRKLTYKQSENCSSCGHHRKTKLDPLTLEACPDIRQAAKKRE